jgi:predicted RNA binding protein YcfA (HicA-like mRNA interferase family)
VAGREVRCIRTPLGSEVNLDGDIARSKFVLARDLPEDYSLLVPRKIRQLVADLERAGFVVVEGGKGSHRKFRHPGLSGSVLLSGQSGDDAKPYQERQIRNAIREASK